MQSFYTLNNTSTALTTILILIRIIYIFKRILSNLEMKDVLVAKSSDLSYERIYLARYDRRDLNIHLLFYKLVPKYI